MKNIKLVLAYDGTDFAGWQRQPGQRTVQGVCEEILTSFTGEAVLLNSSGRTDAGVHALGQVCNFYTESPIPSYKYARLRRLPRDLMILHSESVALDFHARRKACWKQYRYVLDHQQVPHIFQRRFRTHFPCELNLDLMRTEAKAFLGRHDFTSFCSSRSQVPDHVRTIYDLMIWQDGETTIIDIIGNGFLYNMVRIIVGTLCALGRGEQMDRVSAIIEAEDRRCAGPTMPPEGLMLMKVGYQEFASPR